MEEADDVKAEAGRVPVLRALAALPPMSWVLVLSAIQGVNQTVALVLVDDPTPENALDAAVVAELQRLKARL